MPQKENKLILYKDEEGKVSVNTRFADEDMWLTQALLAETYNTAQQNISLHQRGIYADGELDEAATHKKWSSTPFFSCSVTIIYHRNLRDRRLLSEHKH